MSNASIETTSRISESACLTNSGSGFRADRLTLPKLLTTSAIGAPTPSACHKKRVLRSVKSDRFSVFRDVLRTTRGGLF